MAKASTPQGPRAIEKLAEWILAPRAEDIPAAAVNQTTDDERLGAGAGVPIGGDRSGLTMTSVFSIAAATSTGVGMSRVTRANAS